MISDLRTAADSINTRISNYANNFTVQMFYQKYDEWNTRDSTCRWYDVNFQQRCGAGSDGSAGAIGLGTMVKDFAKEMQQYQYSAYFTSKIVVTN